MTTSVEHEARADAWIDVIFGGRGNYNTTKVPGVTMWLLALLADPDPDSTEFVDWATQQTGPDAATGAIVVITSTQVMYVRFVDCPSQQEPTGDQIWVWTRPRSAVRMLTLRGDQNMFSPTRRSPGCLTIQFDDGETLELPISTRADVPKLARLLAPSM